MHKKHFNRFLNTPIPTSVSDSLSYYEEIQRLERGVNDLSEDVDELTEDFDELSEEVNEVSETVGDFDERIVANTNSINSLSSGIEGISTRLTTTENNISSLDAMVDSAQDDIYELQEETTVLGGNIASFNSNSIGRDNALSSRVSLLEDATIQPITLANSSENLIKFGDDLRLSTMPYNMELDYNTSDRSRVVFESGKGIHLVHKESGSLNIPYLHVHGLWADDDSRNISLKTKMQISLLVADNPNTLTGLQTLKANKAITATNGNYSQGISILDSNNTKLCDVKLSYVNSQTFDLTLYFERSEYANVWGKYIVAIKLERGEDFTPIILSRKDANYEEHIKNLISSSVPSITPTTYRNVFTDIDLTSGEETFEDCKIQVALSEQLGMLSGFIAVYVQVDEEGNTIDMSNGCTYQLDVSSLNINPKVNIGANISGFYSNVLNRQQCDIVLTNNAQNTKINTIELRINSAPVFIPRASEDDTVGLFMVVSINDLVSAG